MSWNLQLPKQTGNEGMSKKVEQLIKKRPISNHGVLQTQGQFYAFSTKNTDRLTA